MDLWTALHYAERHGHDVVVRALLDAGADTIAMMPVFTAAGRSDQISMIRPRSWLLDWLSALGAPLSALPSSEMCVFFGVCTGCSLPRQVLCIEMDSVHCASCSP